MGNDINVYLHASEQLSRGENIYSNNLYNRYLYSPLFALLLRPFSILPYEWGRVIWALVNTLAALRCWKILRNILEKELDIDRASLNRWSWGVLLLSAGFFNNNLILGQITIFIVWLTLEGVYQILIKEKNWLGSTLLALGINIKIMPILCLYYLFFKFKWAAVLMTTFLVVVSLFLPALFIGNNYNNELLVNWKNQINPSGERYVFEADNSCHSLNALLPGYFYDFGQEEDNHLYGLKRKIALFSYDSLLLILQLSRFLLLLSVLRLIFYTSKRQKHRSLYFFWEISYLMLVSFLLFPHQLKYAMMYFVPAGSYMIMYILFVHQAQTEAPWGKKMIAILAFVLMAALAIMGRDIIGDVLINIADYYHVMGIITIVFLLLLNKIEPDDLIHLNNSTKKTTAA